MHVGNTVSKGREEIATVSPDYFVDEITCLFGCSPGRIGEVGRKTCVMLLLGARRIDIGASISDHR